MAEQPPSKPASPFAGLDTSLLRSTRPAPEAPAPEVPCPPPADAAEHRYDGGRGRVQHDRDVAETAGAELAGRPALRT